MIGRFWRANWDKRSFFRFYPSSVRTPSLSNLDTDKLASFALLLIFKFSLITFGYSYIFFPWHVHFGIISVWGEKVKYSEWKLTRPLIRSWQAVIYCSGGALWEINSFLSQTNQIINWVLFNKVKQKYEGEILKHQTLLFLVEEGSQCKDSCNILHFAFSKLQNIRVIVSTGV